MLLFGIPFLANEVAAGVIVQSYAIARAIRDYTGAGQQMFVSEDRNNRLGHPAYAQQLQIPFVDNVARANGASITNKVRTQAGVDQHLYQGIYPGTFAASVAFASTTVTETITLVGDPLRVASMLLSRGPLYAKAHLSGSVTNVPGAVFVGPGADDDRFGISASWFYDARLVTGIETAQVTDNALLHEFGLSHAQSSQFDSLFSVNRLLSAQLDFQFDGANWTTSYTRVLSARASVVVGYTDVDFGNSFGISGVTFADGTTPEELGFSLEFGGGRTSPNLTAVPEPSSVAIFCFL